MDNYTVYMHISPSGKRYIGITTNDAKYRWNSGHGYTQNPYFMSAIKKYGWKNIEHKILFEGLAQEEAEAKEIELISFYKSNDRKFGYNISNGGTSTGKHSDETKLKIGEKGKGRIISTETRRKIIEGNKGKKLSLKTRDKISASHIGKKGVSPSEETRRKNSEANKGIKAHQAKPVFQFDLEGRFIKRFEYIKQVTEILGFHNAHISRCCRGELKTSHGFIWRYADDFSANEETIPKLNNIHENKNKGAKHYMARVISQFDLQGNLLRKFDYMQQVQEVLGYNSRCISDCCRGRLKTAYGYILKYADYEDVAV